MRNPYAKRIPSGAEILVGMAADAWRRGRERREFARFIQNYPSEADRLTQDLNTDRASLLKLCGKGVEWRALLNGRLRALGIDPGQLDASETVVARDLARCCALCTHKSRCASDLLRDPRREEWKTYCVNEQTLSALAPRHAGSPARL